MATNIIADVSLNIRELIRWKNFSSEAEFARAIGVSKQNLLGWKKRNSYDINKILDAFPSVNRHWLLTGEGQMLKEPARLTSEETEDAPKAVAYDEETYESAKKLGIALIDQGRVLWQRD